MTVDIVELEVDDANEREFARHAVSVAEILELVANRIRVFRNRRHRSAELIMIGTTNGGRMLTVPIVATQVVGRWRPITAWDSTKAERQRFDGR